MTGRLLPHAVDADVAGLDQRSGAGAGFYDPRMPQPFVETLALQANTDRKAYRVRGMIQRVDSYAKDIVAEIAACTALYMDACSGDR